jgi:hypothetical protein
MQFRRSQAHSLLSRVFDEVSSTDGDPDLLNHTAHSTVFRRLGIEVCYQGLLIYAFMQEGKRALHALSPSMNASTRSASRQGGRNNIFQLSISFDEMLQRQDVERNAKHDGSQLLKEAPLLDADLSKNTNVHGW